MNGRGGGSSGGQSRSRLVVQSVGQSCGLDFIVQPGAQKGNVGVHTGESSFIVQKNGHPLYFDLATRYFWICHSERLDEDNIHYLKHFVDREFPQKHATLVKNLNDTDRLRPFASVF